MSLQKINHQQARPAKLSTISSAFAKMRVDPVLKQKLWNKWLPAEVWVEALTNSNLIDEDFSFNVISFNSAMIKNDSEINGLLIDRFDGTNTTGVFQLSYQKRKYYYVTDPNVQVQYPKPLDRSWKEAMLAAAKDVLPVGDRSERKRRVVASHETSHKRQNTDTTKPQSAPMINGAIGGTMATLTPDERVKNRHKSATTIAPEPLANVRQGTTTVTPGAQAEKQVLPKMFYWNSPEASKLFGVKLERPEDDVRDALRIRIKLLQSVNQDQKGWRKVIEGGDPDNICSGHEIFSIRGRSMTLCLAYQIAIEHMNKWTWKECCTEACKQLNQLGIKQATCPRTVELWNLELRNDGKFSRNNRCGKHLLPPLFAKYPKAMEDIIAFGVENLETLSLEVLQAFCHDVLIPKLLLQWQDDMISSKSWNGERDLLTKERFLKEHSITTLSTATCRRWLHSLGFSYDPQRKGFRFDRQKRILK